MKLKKLSIISLICMMCFTFLPVNLYALEGDAATDTSVVEPAPVEDIITEDTAENDAPQYISYVNENMQAFDLRDYDFNRNSNAKRSMTKAGYSVLNANEKKLYDIFLPEFTKMAEGNKNVASVEVNAAQLFPKTIYTKSELGVSSIATGNVMSDEAYDKICELSNVDLNKLTYTLISNKPYDTYWFDKTNMYGIPAKMSDIKLSTDGESINIEEMKFIYEFPVEKEYSVSNTLKTIDLDTAKTKAASTMVKTKAQEVVAEVTKNNKTHYDILKAYMDWVCEAVDYNTTVKLTDDYGNPWQMVWAFDNDSSTNIVCEGYAKAFKYLCDMTPALTNDGIEVYLMQGDLSGSGVTPQPHMWNVVHMNNGKNYLVDCTNMDPQTIKWNTPNFLFMTGAPKGTGTADGQTGDKYTFTEGNQTVEFTYGAGVMTINVPAEKDLAAEPYNPSDSTTPTNPTTPTDPSTPTDPGTVDPTTPTDPETEDPGTVDPGTEDPEEDEVVVIDDEDYDDENIIDDEDSDDENGTKTKGNTTVKTGDETNMMVYVVLLVVALALVIGLVVYNRKKNKKE